MKAPGLPCTPSAYDFHWVWMQEVLFQLLVIEWISHILHNAGKNYQNQAPLRTKAMGSMVVGKWSFHFTYIYSLPFSQANLHNLEDKMCPFFWSDNNNHSVRFLCLTWKRDSVTFYCCDSCICGSWIPLPGDSHWLCSWLYLLTGDGSLFICNWVAHLV